MKKLITMLAVGTILFSCAKVDPDAAVTVGSETITKTELNAKLDGIIPHIKSKKPNFTAEDSIQLVKDILEMEILAKAILIEAKTDKDLAITDSAANADFEMKKRQYFGGNDSIMTSRLATNNQSVEEFKTELRKGQVIEAFFKRESKKITVDSLELAAFIDSSKNKEQYAKYPTSHILIMSKADSTTSKAAADSIALIAITLIADSLKAGTVTFEDLAFNNSQCPSGKAKKGNLGPGSVKSWDKDFGDAVLKLKPNEVSGIVKSQFGYHIIRLNGEVTYEALGREKMMIENSIKKDKMDKIIENLKETHKVTYYIDLPVDEEVKK